MSEFRFRFHHRGKKLPCPSCGERTWRTYWDHRLNKEAPEEFGICERINNCAYVSYPKGSNNDREEFRPIHGSPMKKTDWRCPPEIVAMTNDHRGNVFAKWIVGLLGDPAKQALRSYRVGTFPIGKKHPELAGSCIWWQIGSDGLHRSGKVMKYNEDGKRIKEHGAQWIHTLVYGKSSDELGIGQCLFGEHLLKERPDAPVSIVESEKTAIICAALYPSHVWLATGGSHGLTMEKCACLAGSNVTLFPDSGCYKEWSDKAIQIGLDVMCESFRVDDTLEALGAPAGDDIADWLVPVRRLPELFSAPNGYPPVMPYEDDLSAAARSIGRDVTELLEECKPTTFATPQRRTDGFRDDWQKEMNSPVERVFGSEQMRTFAQEMDLDLSQATIKPLNE